MLDKLVITYQNARHMGTIHAIKAQLDARRGQWPAICEATGLNYHWLTKFAQGRIADPGSTKIARLSAHLEALGQNEKANPRGARNG